MAENIPLENKHSEEEFDELPLPQNFDDEESTKTNSEGCIQNELLKPKASYPGLLQLSCFCLFLIFLHESHCLASWLALDKVNLWVYQCQPLRMDHKIS